MTTGFGYAQTSRDLPASETAFSGGAGAANIAIGGIVASNLAVHGTLFGWFQQDPDLREGTFSGQTNGDVTMSAIGAGVTYYLMPANVYLSASLGAGQVDFDFFGDTFSTEWGLALDFNLGKEWWVSNNWALGVAGDIGYHNISNAERSAENWSGFNLAVLFSATFN